jgi:hypothetical protein
MSEPLSEWGEKELAAELAYMSTATADIVIGGAVTLEAGELASLGRRTDSLIGLSLHDYTRAQLLAEVERTSVALESYPTTPTLPVVDLSMPAFADMWEQA